MKLVIVHYHLRPGGVRRIIELATPHLLRAFGGAIESVTLAAGEAADAHWRRLFQEQLGTTPVEFFIEPTFGYLFEQSAKEQDSARRLRAAFGRLLGGDPARDCLVWAHNLALARNLLLTRELARACAQRGFPLVSHHHDWWFDNRWQRWPEMRRAGFGSLRATARTIFPTIPNLVHAAINHADARILRRHFGRSAVWLPNPAERVPPPAAARVAAARRWLRQQVGTAAPVWLMPCRLLRRKNIAEALLLTRWLRPAAWLVTIGGVSSADEQTYARRLAAAARQHGWPLRLAILQGDETAKPSVTELLAASETVLLTSIQEGFGLAYVEAAATRRPLIARAIPNIAPDLKRFGFRFPQYYDELLVDPRLFDWNAEQNRQARLFRHWKAQLPGGCRCWVGRPALPPDSEPRPVPFSRLTFTAQLETLVCPPRESWELCAPLNPFLKGWRDRVAKGGLRITPWPRQATNWLSGPAYAQRFRQVVRKTSREPGNQSAAESAQQEFISERLGTEHLFPLLWSRDS